MQQRRSILIFSLVFLALLAGGTLFLAGRDIPAPQGVIETPLDSAKLLNTK